MTLEKRVEQLEKEVAELKDIDFIRRPTARSIEESFKAIADNLHKLQRYERAIPLEKGAAELKRTAQPEVNETLNGLIETSHNAISGAIYAETTEQAHSQGK